MKSKTNPAFLQEEELSQRWEPSSDLLEENLGFVDKADNSIVNIFKQFSSNTTGRGNGERIQRKEIMALSRSGKW